MDFLPVFLDLRARLVLVLGDGPVAMRKAALARQAGAEVRGATVFSPALLDGVSFAIGAEASEDDLAALSASAGARGIPVNIV
ncbi:MAG TPA: NAD(P)-dependent oxidoreductase, partial [Acetobacteraceae bacterium]|nr:NAD(P)-dependent oxidoreductase [Acetobacteraceae bacterium]